MKVTYILNPISGTVKKENVAVLIDKYADKDHYDYKVVYTEYAGHAEEIARSSAKEGVDVVVAVGGDGTVNEIARALIHTETALGIIPCGSGNGLARHLMLPMNVKQSIDIINKMVIHRLDSGVIDGHPFLCTCGVGFDAFIADKFAKAGKRGMMTYVEKMFSEGLSYEPENYRVHIDGHEPFEQKAWLISCANASQFGNNAYIAPHASMKDGELDVVVMDPFSLIDAVSVNLDLINKTMDKNSKTKTFKSKGVTIKREKEGLIHFDGEPVMAPAEVRIQLFEKSVNVVVNPNADKRKRNPNFFQVAMSVFLGEIDSLQKDIVEQGKIIHKDILKQSRNIQKLNQNILGKLK